ncbi:hypothetical protein Btru_029155 [Bulinus truncatus]|nr:hypothetical protein Btru_029155 [Bulinus truncatus]
MFLQNVKKETSGDLQEILLERINGKTQKISKESDKQKAEKDAKLLHENLSAVVKEIFKCGPTHFKATSESYKELFKEDISESIKKACAGDTESGLFSTHKMP